MQGYYEKLTAEFGPFSLVPAIRAGKCSTPEDSKILGRLQYRNSRGVEAGCVAQVMMVTDRIMPSVFPKRDRTGAWNHNFERATIGLSDEDKTEIFNARYFKREAEFE